MKKLIGLLLVVLFTVSMSSCYNSRHAHRMPPGHAKKVYGSKSAKKYAPGQQKKKKKGNKHYRYEAPIQRGW
ncbi:quinol oxidase subunit 4 [Sphingobacterium sp. LRF_L2]|uniref:quinol oxidase subunit 4 n=1 Tax=Sphingobacterium sp. LRF_L2 TaxID=3369421 RepID=UPI003F620C8B